MQYAMDDDAFLDAFEIDAVILGAIAVELLAVPLKHTEALGVEIIEIIGQHFELREKVELQILGQRGHFPSTQFVEDDLKHGRRN